MKTHRIEEYFAASNSKGVKVLLWLLRNRDKEGIIETTLDDVATQCSVTKVTVNRIFQNLYKAEFLVKIKNGTYQMRNI